MKKLFLIFLLFVMPLQASWAVVAAYCQPETEVTAKHFGHHEHQQEHHHAQVGQDSDEDSTALKISDCADCHGLYSGMVVYSLDTPHAGPVAGPPVNATSQFISTASSRPEKPKWFSAI
ncbi:hypothetical protein RY831_24050 [Noviherbaspirillum sp. CPCC 100848]|uniref:Cobalt-zinc-cadmium resistance protein n=1 Tax=Noviherbaspirillum album TaxID=3080276 RepID=A0ABU6JFK7_9BURK|nr:hypothetical protein [Noviherbaspirillum sp. CPCC 100848]MEC4722241.1 hypothetical protein [Noviherbaspirillum sp. CPCC 100848]